MQGSGKRAALAMFYGPLHFLTVRHIVRELASEDVQPTTLCDLGCGTGAAGAAWALESGVRSAVCVDLHPWALGEARWTWDHFGLRARFRRERAESATLPGPRSAILLAYVVNELSPDARAALLPRLLESHERGARILVLEPISRRTTPWWDAWSEQLTAAGGRDDNWRFLADLPPSLRLMDKAASLDHRYLTARTLYL